MINLNTDKTRRKKKVVRPTVLLFIAIMTALTACESNWVNDGDALLCYGPSRSLVQCYEDNVYLSLGNTDGNLRTPPTTLSFSIVFGNGESFAFQDVGNWNDVLPSGDLTEKRKAFMDIYNGNKRLSSQDRLTHTKLGIFFSDDEDGDVWVALSKSGIKHDFQKALKKNKKFTISCPELDKKWQFNKN